MGSCIGFPRFVSLSFSAVLAAVQEKKKNTKNGSDCVSKNTLFSAVSQLAIARLFSMFDEYFATQFASIQCSRQQVHTTVQ